jgi:hypothetical protein
MYLRAPPLVGATVHVRHHMHTPQKINRPAQLIGLQVPCNQ